jgi:hypothetical protein
MNARHIITVFAATAFGVVSGLLVAGFRPGAPPPAPIAHNIELPAAPTEPGSEAETTEAAALIAIRNELAFERDARFAMAEELDEIWAELGKLSTPNSDVDVPRPPRPPRPSPKQATAPGTQKWFDTASLLEIGVPDHEAERLRELYEAEQLDELYLRDVATREGWMSTPRYRKDLQRLRRELRVELGDEDYDRVTYASGKFNRVAVDDVLQNSAGSAIGLRKGDVIVRYDGQLILTPPELRNATARGSADETTAIDVLRNSETLRFYVPRGPLGVRIGQTRRPPQ